MIGQEHDRIEPELIHLRLTKNKLTNAISRQQHRIVARPPHRYTMPNFINISIIVQRGMQKEIMAGTWDTNVSCDAM
jgi:hypothetical protein